MSPPGNINILLSFAAIPSLTSANRPRSIATTLWRFTRFHESEVQGYGRSEDDTAAHARGRGGYRHCAVEQLGVGRRSAEAGHDATAQRHRARRRAQAPGGGQRALRQE